MKTLLNLLSAILTFVAIAVVGGYTLYGLFFL